MDSNTKNDLQTNKLRTTCQMGNTVLQVKAESESVTESELRNSNTKNDLQTNKLRTTCQMGNTVIQLKAESESVTESELTNFNEILANHISGNTFLEEIKDVTSKNSVGSSGILKSPTRSRSLITGKIPDNNCPTKLKFGSISLIGGRKEMEDTITIEPAIIPGKFSFFGVYDGHGGSDVANSCRDRLHSLLHEELAISGEVVDWTQIMMTCFFKMDEEVKIKYDDFIGSTATVAIVGVEEIVVANCGDSRAVISRGGVALPLSIDHKPTRPDELKRVEEVGGHVANWDGCCRIKGLLALSRSIGDHYFRPSVISEPTVKVNKRTNSDEFLILATDGLWDVMSNQDACNVVRNCCNGKAKNIFPKRPSATDVAAYLANMAIAKGSHDNISIILVDLKMRP